MWRNGNWIAPCALLLLLVSSSVAQRGALTAPTSLDQLAQQAQTIVHGSVISAKTEPHPQYPNLMTVVVRFSVSDSIKGNPGKVLEFRQYIWDIRDRLDHAQYRKGQELLLLLNPVATTGLTSPVGLGQGRFHITRNAAGDALAANESGNTGLFSGTEQRVKSSGIRLSPRSLAAVRAADSTQLRLDDLKVVLRDLSGRPQ